MDKMSYVKITGLRFDALSGLQIVNDSNVKDYKEAGKYAEEYNDRNTIFIAVPCEITYI